MQRLRGGISQLVKSMPTRIRTTREMKQVLGTDVKLSWQLMKLIGPGDPLSLTPFVPTTGAMLRFMKAATKAGANAEVIDQIRSAYDAFNEQVAIHAGDRATFESMAASAVGKHDGFDTLANRPLIKLRKAGFQTYSHYCGIQQDTGAMISFLHPAADSGASPEHFDVVHLMVKLGLRRLRPDADCLVSRLKGINSSDLDSPNVYRQDVLDREAYQKYGAPVIPSVSSNPLPLFETIVDPENGEVSTYVTGESVGQRSATDLVFGQTTAGVKFEKIPGDTKYGFGQALLISIPSTVIILDQLVHRPSFPKVEGNLVVRWQTAADARSERDTGGPLTFNERPVRLEGGVDGGRTHEIPEYIEMIDFACRQMNWRKEDFDVYRIRVEYPLYSTLLWSMYTAELAKS